MMYDINFLSNLSFTSENIPALLCGLLFVGFLLTAAIGDIKSFQISNQFNIIFFLSFLIIAPLIGLGANEIFFNLLVAAAAFGFCFVLFAFGLFGGGDLKLVGATAVWLGAGPMMAYALGTALFGGLLAVGVLVARMIAKKFGLPRNPKWLRQMLRNHSAIPYGVALCLGGIFALPLAAWIQG